MGMSMELCLLRTSRISMNKKSLIAVFGLFFLGLILLVGGMKSIPPDLTPALSPTPIVESTNSGTLGIEGQKVVITKVIDGDTVEIKEGLKVRYIGIDTPETVDPRRPVGCFGKEASAENKRLAEGHEAFLVKDVSETDKFGRLLRYVYIFNEDGSTVFINDHLVRYGFAKVSTFPPDVKYSEQFLAAEREARENNRGLWNKCQ